MQQITALHPKLEARTSSDPSADPPVFGLWDDGREGWTRLGANSTTWYHQTDIDLSGYALQDLSFFPQAVGVQDPGLYSLRPAETELTGVLVQVIDLVTSVPLNEEELLLLSDRQLFGIGPGMMGSNQDFETLMMGQYSVYTADSSLKAIQGSLVLQRSVRFGSGEPTAADKLTTYRIASFFVEPNFPNPFTENDLFRIPAARYLLNGEMVAEPDLVHMMRLKRSYELANQE
jgi:hypothetical protein